MKVQYAPRAVADLVEIAEHSRKAFGAGVAATLETTIRAAIACLNGAACASYRSFAILSKFSHGCGRHSHDIACAPCLASSLARVRLKL
jgi:hypothetical protein